MALITETGAGLPDAESLCSVEDATDYHAARGNAAWAALASDTVREQMLRRATDYIEAIYGPRWAGSRVSVEQALSWPRNGVPFKDIRGACYAHDLVPAVVAKACAELALRASKGELDPDPAQVVKRTKVDVVEKEYFEPAKALKRHKFIDEMLEPLLGVSPITIRLVRA